MPSPFLTRRELLRRGVAGGAIVATGGLLQACGSGGVRAAPVGRFEPSPGTEIPSADVRFAMWPFGDTSMGFIGIEQGFFDDVGINLVPRRGETQLTQQTPGELLSGQLDLASGFMPLQIQVFAKQPDLKMVQLTDVYVGNYLLASPSVGAKTYEQLAKPGESFEALARGTVQQIKGKRVALTTVGNNRDFFSTLLELAGLTPADFKLTVVDDTKILQLARAGDIDFAMPAGAAQNLVLMKEGYFRVFGVGQLLRHLPPGDARAVGAVGHAGIAGTAKYINANTDTLLRFTSVYYRIIDQLLGAEAAALAIELPHLNAATGLELTVEDAKAVFKRFYQLVSFEQAANHLLSHRYPLQLDNVYVPQIDAARKAGIYKATDNVTPEDIFVGTRLYRILADLKRRYESIKASRAPNGPLARNAAEHYRNRNYLDAYRLINAAEAG
jgi:ABC-type nitrate/sulfonate/bicarbonate transport system substrate-binding protein